MSESLKNAIVAKNVSFNYGKPWNKLLVLNSVNINVEKGEIYGLLGPSGCGKTTLLKLIIGLKEPNNGHISVFGYKPGFAESGTPGIGVGYMPQEISLPDHMTINEIFKYFGKIYLLDNELIATNMKYLLKILHLNNEKALICNLSGGEKRRASLAIALFSSPRLLILDEPTVGVDPLLRQTIWSLLTQLTQQSKTTIIVTTHYIEEMRCAKTVAFMRRGEILEETEPNKAIEEHNCMNLESLFLKLCENQQKRKRFVTSKSSHLNNTNSEIGKKCNTSVFEPLKDERKRNRFINETLPINAVVLKAFYRYLRNGGLTVAYIIPLLCISSTIFCIGNNPSDAAIGWIVDELLINDTLTAEIDKIPYLPDLLLSCINKKVINIIKYDKVDEAVKDARKRKVMGYIHLKQNFSENFYKRDILLIDDSDYVSNETINTGNVHLSLDATNLILQQLIVRELFETVLKFREKAFIEIGIDANVSSFPFKLAEPIHGKITNEQFTHYTHNAAICILVIICLLISISFTADSMITDINSDVHSRSMSAGLKPRQLIIGQFIARFLYLSSTPALSFIVLIYVFNVNLKGSLLLAIINIQLTILSGVGLGTLFAVFIQHILFCHAFVTAISISIIVLSGTIWPLEAQPYFIKPFVTFIPGILPITAMLKIFNYEHVDFTTYILPGFASSTFYCVISGVLSTYFLKKLAL